jgi:hypothetical protein
MHAVIYTDLVGLSSHSIDCSFVQRDIETVSQSPHVSGRMYLVIASLWVSPSISKTILGHSQTRTSSRDDAD